MTSPWDTAHDRPAFSNGTEWECWSYNWCDRCLVDAPFRNGLKGARGCELIVIALDGKTPAEWLEQERNVLGDQYHCINFRPPGSGGGEPRPKPTPPGQGALLPREGLEGVRMYVQPQEAAVPS